MTAGRILTVTLNPALDVTYRVRTLCVGETVPVDGVCSRAGGKGVNVASVVRSLGGDSLVLGLGCGREPDGFRAGLRRLGLPHRLVPALDAVRRTVAVVAADGTTTMLREPGAVAAPGAGAAVTELLRDELAAGAGAVVVSGSVPPGLEVELPARLAADCVARGVPVIVDVSGPALRAAAGVGAVLMPNRGELAELTGSPLGSPGEIEDAARRLVGAGAAAVVATLGEDGMTAVIENPEVGDPGVGGPVGCAVWRARPVAVVSGNPTGAGDAAAAALAGHLASAGGTGTTDWARALADAVATSAACVLRPVAGEIDAVARSRWLAGVAVEAAGVEGVGVEGVGVEMAGGGEIRWS